MFKYLQYSVAHNNISDINPKERGDFKYTEGIALWRTIQNSLPTCHPKNV